MLYIDASDPASFTESSARVDESSVNINQVINVSTAKKQPGPNSPKSNFFITAKMAAKKQNAKLPNNRRKRSAFKIFASSRKNRPQALEESSEVVNTNLRAEFTGKDSI